MQSVAVKQLKQHDACNDIRFLREIAILKECRSGHVVQFLVRSLTIKGSRYQGLLSASCNLAEQQAVPLLKHSKLSQFDARSQWADPFCAWPLS